MVLVNYASQNAPFLDLQKKHSVSVWPLCCMFRGKNQREEAGRWNGKDEGQSWITMGPRIRRLGWGGARMGPCTGPWGTLRKLICSHGCLQALLNWERVRSLRAFLWPQHKRKWWLFTSIPLLCPRLRVEDWGIEKWSYSKSNSIAENTVEIWSLWGGICEMLSRHDYKLLYCSHKL